MSFFLRVTYNAHNAFASNDLCIRTVGIFSGNLFFDLRYFHGTPSGPLRLTSVDSANPAMIVTSQTAIAILTQGDNSANVKMNLVIDHLILIGDGSQGTSGILVYLSSSISISNLVVDNVDASGFCTAGMNSYRSQPSPTAFITNVRITNSAFHDNPGLPNLFQIAGNGIVLNGVRDVLIQNCVAYNNGAKMNVAPGPLGIWVFDADSVTIRNCTSHNNLVASGNDGGGFDFDCGTTNSVMEYCLSYENYGAGYNLNACGQGSNFNNGGATEHNFIRDSVSIGDTYGQETCSVCVFGGGVFARNNTFLNMFFEVLQTTKTVVQYGNNFNNFNAIAVLEDSDQIFFQNCTFVFPSVTYSNDLVCSDFTNPLCLPLTTSGAPTSAPISKPTVNPTFIPTFIPTVAPTLKPTFIPTLKPTFIPTVAPTSKPTIIPTLKPTNIPTIAPTAIKTVAPTSTTSFKPAQFPTVQPTAATSSLPSTNNAGFNFYVSSLSNFASDLNSGGSQTLPWSTLKKVDSTFAIKHSRGSFSVCSVG